MYSHRNLVYFWNSGRVRLAGFDLGGCLGNLAKFRDFDGALRLALFPNTR